MKTEALISCVFVFACAESLFSHNEAQLFKVFRASLLENDSVTCSVEFDLLKKKIQPVPEFSYSLTGVFFVFVVFFCLQFSTAVQKYMRTTWKSAARE